jgi:hypothetical protein
VGVLSLYCREVVSGYCHWYCREVVSGVLLEALSEVLPRV